MNWDDLRFFIAVANASNITDAGQALKVSASTVSRKILVLEQAMGSMVDSHSGQLMSWIGGTGGSWKAVRIALAPA